MILLDGVWKKLESELPKGDRISARLVLPMASKKLYAGFDSNKQRHLLIPLDRQEDELTDSQSRGLSVVTQEFILPGMESKNYIDIICQESSGHLIFDVIANELSERLGKANSKDVVINVLSKWRRFWGQPVRDLLTYEEVIGLFAELWFLYHWLLPRASKIDAIKSWRGPYSSRHDFELKMSSVEVKATTNVQSRTHKIHGIDQLSPPQKGELFFFSLRLREEQGADSNLPEFIGACREKLKDDADALAQFENSLAIVGYSPLYDEEYSKFKFRIVDERLYTVKDKFPRIIVDSFVEGVPSGVGAIEYLINLDGYDNLCIARSPVDNFDLQ